MPMANPRWLSARFAIQFCLLFCFLLGSKTGLAMPSDLDEFVTPEKGDKVSGAPHTTTPWGQPNPGITEPQPPEKTSRHSWPTTIGGGPLLTTTRGGDGPDEPTVTPVTSAGPTSAPASPETSSGTPTHQPLLTTASHTKIGVATGPATIKQSTATPESWGTTRQSTFMSSQIKQTSSPIFTTAAAPTTAPRSTPTQRQHVSTQGWTTLGSTEEPSLSTRHTTSPRSTGKPWPMSQQPPSLPSQGPSTREPLPTHTQQPPIHTEKPHPPTKPHKPTRPHPTDRPHPTGRPHKPTTSVVPVPTQGPTTRHITNTPTSHLSTPTSFPYPDVAVQLFLETTWVELCPDIKELLLSIAEYSMSVLNLSYLHPVGTLNDTTSCPQGVWRRDVPVNEVQVDICVLTAKGQCDTELTENVGVKMQTDVAGLQKHLQPKFQVLSVRVYKPSQSTTMPHATSPSAAGIAIGLTLSLIITGSATAVFVYKIYRSRQSKRRALHNRYYYDGTKLHDTLSESHQLSPMQHTMSIMPATVCHLVPAVNQGLIMDDEEDLVAQKFPSHVLSMNALSQFYSYLEAIVEEFETLPDFQSSTCRPRSPSKQSLTTSGLFHPPPKTRVPLEKVSDNNQHGFLNASFVRGYGKARCSYIATTAPWGTNLADFWQMIWEQQSRTIICLCSPEEMGVVCPWYWPREEGIQAAQLYGDILVMRQGCILTENYAMSTLLIKNIQNSLCRPVSHFWFTQWPVVCDLVPSSSTVLLSFLLQVRQTVQESYGPIVTHCSDGCGRTGTLLAIDIAMRSMEDLCTVDVPHIVCSIRRDRGAAVPQRNHYVFIYKALYEYSVMLTRGMADGMAADVEDIDAGASLC